MKWEYCAGQFIMLAWFACVFTRCSWSIRLWYTSCSAMLYSPADLHWPYPVHVWCIMQCMLRICWGAPCWCTCKAHALVYLLCSPRQRVSLSTAAGSWTCRGMHTGLEALYILCARGLEGKGCVSCLHQQVGFLALRCIWISFWSNLSRGFAFFWPLAIVLIL